MNPILLLFVASCALVTGPLCGVLGERSRVIRAAVDGLALVVIGGVCLLVVLPHVITHLGIVGVLITASGIGVSIIAHRMGAANR